MALAYSADPMSLTVATWNINSVRLRIGNVERYLRLRKPDVLCLQETKCPDEFFPHQPFEALGYTQGRNLQLIFYGVPSSGPRGEFGAEELRAGQ